MSAPARSTPVLDADASAEVATLPPRREGAAANVWREILRGLYEGKYRPGQRLTEAELTREFQVSRSSVREALSRLAAEGVVEIVRHRGAVVRSVSKAEHLEILRVMDSLIGLAARLAAENIEAPGHREAIRQELKRLASPPDNLTTFDFARERNRFYRVLLGVAANSELKRLMSTVHSHAIRLQLSERAIERVFAEYIVILAAVLAGDPDGAEAAARAHVASGVAEIGRLPD